MSADDVPSIVRTDQVKGLRPITTNQNLVGGEIGQWLVLSAFKLNPVDRDSLSPTTGTEKNFVRWSAMDCISVLVEAGPWSRGFHDGLE